jgi:ABC-type Co2+ transport system permease subunit
MNVGEGYHCGKEQTKVLWSLITAAAFLAMVLCEASPNQTSAHAPQHPYATVLANPMLKHSFQMLYLTRTKRSKL